MTIIKSETITGKLTHWVKPEFVECVLSGNNKLHQGIFIKPLGVWLSWNNGWEEWCESEPNFISGRICLEAKLKDGLNVWLIDSIKDFNDIWNQFDNKTEFSTILIDNKFWHWLQDTYHIDVVALTDKGQWATRMNTWLYGWDCASIVVFNSKNVKFSIKK